MTHTTRQEARSEAYRTLGVGWNWKLIETADGWEPVACDRAESENAKPTFEFFNEEDVRTATLGRLYACATSLGFSNVCAMTRDELTENVLAELRKRRYNLDRVEPTMLEPWNTDPETPDGEDDEHEEHVMATGKTAAKKTAAKKATSKVAKKSIGPAKTPAAKKSVAKTAKPKVERLRQNGFTRPVGGKTGRVWDIADKISEKQKRPATRAEVLAQAVDKEGAKKSMAATQYSRWRAFFGLGRDTTKAEKPATAKKAAAKTTAKAPTKRAPAKAAGAVSPATTSADSASVTSDEDDDEQ